MPRHLASLRVPCSHVACVLLLALCPAGAHADEPSSAPSTFSCDIQRSRQVDLTGAKEPQTLTASVKGDDCRAATFRITVTAKKGTILYVFTHPWSDMSVFYDWTPEEVNAEAKRMFGYVLELGVKPMPDGKTLKPVEENPGIIDEWRLVDLKRYEALRAQGFPMLCHSTWYEGHVCVVYDRASRGFIPVIGT